jgi:hypothetical protein
MIKYKVRYDPPAFTGHTQPHGALAPHPACQALWYYYLLAKKQLELSKETIILEGTTHYPPVYKDLFNSVRLMYNVKPEQMIKFWKHIDRQCEIMDFPSLPQNDSIRFDKVGNITGIVGVH